MATGPEEKNGFAEPSVVILMSLKSVADSSARSSKTSVPGRNLRATVPSRPPCRELFDKPARQLRHQDRNINFSLCEWKPNQGTGRAPCTRLWFENGGDRGESQKGSRLNEEFPIRRG